MTHQQSGATPDDPRPSSGGVIDLGPTGAEFFSAFAPATAGLMVGAILIPVGTDGPGIAPVSIVGIGICALALLLVVLELRDLPHRTIRWNRAAITVVEGHRHASAGKQLTLQWSQLAMVTLRAQPERLFHVLPVTMVRLHLQPLAGTDSVQVALGLGQRRLGQVDNALRKANSAYRGIVWLDAPTRRGRARSAPVRA